jgi:hypothetical protein
VASVLASLCGKGTDMTCGVSLAPLWRVAMRWQGVNPVLPGWGSTLCCAAPVDCAVASGRCPASSRVKESSLAASEEAGADVPVGHGSGAPPFALPCFLAHVGRGLSAQLLAPPMQASRLERALQLLLQLQAVLVASRRCARLHSSPCKPPSHALCSTYRTAVECT